ncbi:MAG: hypothetical protein P8P56_02620 [Yoonia sp.]|nr:hypothetical protein [Yoonia sp.]
MVQSPRNLVVGMKGSLNQRAMRANHTGIIDQLYTGHSNVIGLN